MTRPPGRLPLSEIAGYAELVQRFTWQIPDRVNIAQTVFAAWEEDPLRQAIVAERDDGVVSTWTFAELADLAGRHRRLLDELGVKRGDRVGIVMPQAGQTAAFHLAVYALGAVAVPMSRLYGPESYRHMLDHSGAVAAVIDERDIPKLREVRDHLPALRHVLVHGMAEKGEVSLDDAPGPSAADPVETAADDPAMLLYTSGSTGRPKGVLHGHRILAAYLPTFQLFFNGDFDESTVLYTPSDWAWVGGLLDVLLPALALGHRVVAYDGRFSPERTLEVMSRHGVTHSFLTPTAVNMLAEISPLQAGDLLDLRVIASGGESVGAAAHTWAGTMGAVINEFYGLTEVNHLVGSCSRLWPSRPGSMGRPYPGREVAVVDDAGRQTPPHEVGEIAVRPGDPTQMLGYWNDPEATASRYRFGWMMTGDLAHTDGDGYIYFRGRDDDVISTSGHRVGPGEIEEALLLHPAVSQAAVVGVSDPARGQIIKAYVTPSGGRSGDDALARELQGFVKARLAAHKYPRQIEFVEGLPLTTTGKIDRRRLARLHDPPPGTATRSSGSDRVK